MAGPLVAAEDDALAYVLGMAAEADIEADDVWVVQVLDANEEYLRAIGALGEAIAPAEPTDEPTGDDPRPPAGTDGEG